MLHRLLKIILPLLLLISITAKAVNTAIEDPKPPKKTTLSQSKKAKNNRTKSYRYGMNGKEQDNEIKGNGNSLDFGDRMLDTRLGRWLSVDPLRGMYTSFSPYCFAANSPIGIKDDDGRLLVDKNGNIIYTEIGKERTESYSMSSTDPNRRTATRVQDVNVYANDGTPILAQRITKVEQIWTDVVDRYDKDGNAIMKKGWADVEVKKDDEAYDCHGLSMLNGKFWLNGAEMNKLLEKDGYYTNQGEGQPMTDENIKTPGMVAVYNANEDMSYDLGDGAKLDVKKGAVTHSALTKGDGTLNSKNGSKPYGNYTNEQLEKEYNSKGKLYKKEPNRIVDVKGKQIYNGTTEVSKKKVSKAVGSGN